jgi:hypothetical protein
VKRVGAIVRFDRTGRTDRHCLFFVINTVDQTVFSFPAIS